MRWFLNKHKEIQNSDFIETSKLYTDVKRNPITIVNHKAEEINEYKDITGSNITTKINQIAGIEEPFYTDIFMKRWENFIWMKNENNQNDLMEVDEN